jgi:ABC-type Fe3+-hydroxamate transport system substrate-binding protein
MRFFRVLAVLLSLFALCLSAGTIELKTGERIEGKFIAATSTHAVIEVAGQSITIPLEKVRAIYFGAVPARTVAGPPPSHEALDALKALQSVAQSGIAYREYATRVLDARVKVDQYLSSQADTTELRRAIRGAIMDYELAGNIWLANISGFRAENGDLLLY